jgi:hypothetical protein
VLPDEGAEAIGLGGGWWRTLACSEPLAGMLGTLSDPAAMAASAAQVRSSYQLAT